MLTNELLNGRSPHIYLWCFVSTDKYVAHPSCWLNTLVRNHWFNLSCLTSHTPAWSLILNLRTLGVNLTAKPHIHLPTVQFYAADSIASNGISLRTIHTPPGLFPFVVFPSWMWRGCERVFVCKFSTLCAVSWWWCALTQWDEVCLVNIVQMFTLMRYV